MDETQVIGESLGFTRNGEALVLNPKGWKVAYHGAAADALAEAVDALVADEPVKIASTDAVGCAIAMPERDRRTAHAQISYEKTIAPMLLDKCVACHREGGIGPWQMTSYEMIKGFAPMIREVVRTQRMPPWHADPHYQTFSNDRGLSHEQVEDARSLDRGGSAARRRRRSAAVTAQGLAEVDAGRTRSGRRTAARSRRRRPA